MLEMAPSMKDILESEEGGAIDFGNSTNSQQVRKENSSENLWSNNLELSK